MDQALREAFRIYLVLECGRAPRTAQAYLESLRLVEGFLGEPAERLTATDLRRFKRDATYKPSTKGVVIAATKALHRWGALEGLWELNGIAAVPAPAPATSLQPGLSPEQVSELLAACERPTEYRLVYLGLYAGTRLGESSAMAAEQWGPDRLEFTGKGSKVRQVPVHPRLAAVRSAVLARGPYRSTMALAHVKRQLVERVGFAFKTHALRRTFAQALLDADVALEVVESLLGHAPRSTTLAAYASVPWRRKVAAIELLELS